MEESNAALASFYTYTTQIDKNSWNNCCNNPICKMTGLILIKSSLHEKGPDYSFMNEITSAHVGATVVLGSNSTSSSMKNPPFLSINFTANNVHNNCRHQ